MKIMKLSPEEIIQRSQAGDQQAFGLLFERYKNLVYRTAYLLTDDESKADDALQEVFVKVFRSLPSYQPAKGAFTTWLYRITVNYCLNQHRKKRLTLVPLEWAGPNNSRMTAPRENRLDEDFDLELALSELSPKLRAVLILRYYAGLSYAEIAESLDIPMGTVKSRINLGLKNLREQLEPTDAVKSVDHREVVS